MKCRKWLSKYDRLASKFAEQHFGGWNGVLRLFTYMDTPKLNWKDNDSFPGDVYLVRKLANEYHGLERHAQQYHITAQYEYAYHHWLMAAYWRRQNMAMNNLHDEKHLRAIDFDLRCASYNKALEEWSNGRSMHPRKSIPEPYHFRLKTSIMEQKDVRALSEIEAVYNKGKRVFR